jgi:hypothetical protein
LTAGSGLGVLLEGAGRDAQHENGWPRLFEVLAAYSVK